MIYLKILFLVVLAYGVMCLAGWIIRGVGDGD